MKLLCSAITFFDIITLFRRVSETLHESLPNLDTIILTNNMVSELVEIDNLQNLANLRVLSLLFNPVATKDHYRLYVIFKLPQLKLLDFRKIKQKVFRFNYNLLIPNNK